MDRGPLQKVSAYYNEIDPYAVQWLRNLVAAGYIAPGDVDERSIVDVHPDDLLGYDQCHFFAGIGGWSIALRLAEWPDDQPVWTGSCPCQPFSAAGQQKGFDDTRHLWPEWFRLVKKCRPAIIFGEQVEAAIRQSWLDLVFADLEAEGYACGAAVLPACGVGAPHIRQRCWFVADDQHGRRQHEQCVGARARAREQFTNGSTTGELAHSDGGHPGTEGLQRGGEHGQRAQGGGAGCGLVNPASEQVGLPGRARQPRATDFWSSAQWLPCTDGKSRPVEPGSFPLAHGVQRRTSKLRAYGNAIVPQVAAEFIRATYAD